ncbi:hypothetical protein ACFE35_23255 [Phormidesmis priestleyi ANT.L61.2]
MNQVDRNGKALGKVMNFRLKPGIFSFFRDRAVSADSSLGLHFIKDFLQLAQSGLDGRG